MANGEQNGAPFTLDELKAQLKQLDEADSYLRRAVAAGIDMSAQSTKSAEIRAQLLKFAQAFYPGRV